MKRRGFGRGGEGFSLAETVLALFLLMTAIFLAVELFHRAFRLSQGSLRELEASSFGNKIMAEIQAWSRDPDNFESNWAPYDGVTRTDPDFGSMTARIDCQPTGVTVFSPCSGVEQNIGGAPVRMDQVVVPVQVTVSWGAGRQLVLATRLAHPGRPAQGVQIVRTGPPDPVLANQVVDFEARLLDDRGQPLPGVTFRWYDEPVSLFPVPPGPGPGSASFSVPNRDGREAHLSTSPGYEPGTVRVHARACYFGREYWQHADVLLQ